MLLLLVVSVNLFLFRNIAMLTSSTHNMQLFNTVMNSCCIMSILVHSYVQLNCDILNYCSPVSC